MKDIWKFENVDIKLEEYPHFILRKYAEGLKAQTSGEIEISIRNQLLSQGFETNFFVKLEHIGEVNLFKVQSPGINIYPVTIIIGNKHNPIYCDSSVNFEIKMDELIKDKLGKTVSYYLRLNKIKYE